MSLLLLYPSLLTALKQIPIYQTGYVPYVTEILSQHSRNSNSYSAWSVYALGLQENRRKAGLTYDVKAIVKGFYKC